VDYIAMELLRGKTLEALIPRKGLRLNESLKIAVQIAEALTAAHEAAIVHRDLKPGNVMVTESGIAKVLDFGVAYMSPEQAEGKTVDARSDIFSFGAILYEMLSGQRAFPGDTKMSTLAAVLRAEPKPLPELVGGIPREVERLVMRCLRKDASARPTHGRPQTRSGGLAGGVRQWFAGYGGAREETRKAALGHRVRRSWYPGDARSRRLLVVEPGHRRRILRSGSPHHVRRL
jgi:serine/threonine protein kinase